MKAPTRSVQNPREVNYSRWKRAGLVDSDPYYNPNLTRRGVGFSIDPVESALKMLHVTA